MTTIIDIGRKGRPKTDGAVHWKKIMTTSVRIQQTRIQEPTLERAFSFHSYMNVGYQSGPVYAHGRLASAVLHFGCQKRATLRHAAVAERADPCSYGQKTLSAQKQRSHGFVEAQVAS